MDICFTCHRYAPLVGGYENQLRLLAENLANSFNVKVVTFKFGGSKAFESLNRVDVYRVKPQLTFFRVPFSTDYLRILSKLNFDLLHAHGFVPVVSDFSVFQAKVRKKLAVYTHHFDGNVQDSSVLNVGASFYNKTMGKFCVDSADAVVATSKSYAETSPMLKRSMDKVRVIPCFVDCQRFEPQLTSKVAEFKRHLGLKGRTVLFVGRLVPYKGLEYLVKAFERLKFDLGEDFQLLIVGEGEGKRITDSSEYSQRIQCLAKVSSARDYIHFLGRVEDYQLPMYYSLADVVVLPSVLRGEAFGSTLLESLACGTPVVASSLPGVGDVLKGNNLIGSYVHPGDDSGLSHALVKMAYQKEDVTERCREFVLKNYDVKEIVKKYEALYTSIA